MRKFLFLALFSLLPVVILAQDAKPLTQPEFVKMLAELKKNPSNNSALAETIRQRGIGFELTSGLRGLVLTKGGDETLRRTLEEAARRRANPTAFAPPNAKEAADALAKARTETLAAVEEMPDFVVEQLVGRSYAYAGTNTWKPLDKLVVAVSYSTEKGEDYKVLAVNGIPQAEDKSEFAFQKLGGTTSTGEFVTVLKKLFTETNKTEFEVVDSDVVRGRRTIVYNFKIRRENIKETVQFGDEFIYAGWKGKIWVDRENFRILRIDMAWTDFPSNFEGVSAGRRIEYDWVTIAGQKYLLPSLSEIRSIGREQNELIESRNLIAFRNYQKYGSEVKVLDGDDEIVEDAPEKP